MEIGEIGIAPPKRATGAAFTGVIKRAIERALVEAGGRRGTVQPTLDLAAGRANRLRMSQAGIEERVEKAFVAFKKKHIPLGLLWVSADQSERLRKTHGTQACDELLDGVARMFAEDLNSAEEVAPWADHELLVILHEPTASVLAARAQVLARMARRLPLYWWEGRPMLTVSIGAAQAEEGERLVQLLQRLHAAKMTSVREGGDRITLAPERNA